MSKSLSKEEFPFDLAHHGDEVIVQPHRSDGSWTANIKIQTGINESRHIKLTAPSQTVMFGLIPLFIKAPR